MKTNLISLCVGISLVGVSVAAPVQFHFIGADVLPDVVVDGEPLVIHCQGLYVTRDQYLITGRCESQPKRALLLRLNRADPHREFEYVDLTPPRQDGQRLDHPGGFDRDAAGKFWIPLSTSHARGPSLICRYDLDTTQPLSASEADFCFHVDDHIGAVCRAMDGGLMGANWDTKQVYVWSEQGEPLKRFDRSELLKGLPDWQLAIQDWKFVHRGNRNWILAGGLDKSRGISQANIQLIDPANGSLLANQRFSTRSDVTRPITNEGLAWHEDTLYLLPEDIGRGAKVLRYRIEW